MKRTALFASLLVCFAGFPLAAAEESPATALAEKQQLEDRLTSLTTRIENLDETLQAHKKRMEVLAEELKSIREKLEQQNNSAANAALQKNLEKLAEAITEVDRKRENDFGKFQAALADIKKILEKPASAPPRSTTVTTPPAHTTETGWEYTIRSGDNPAVIAANLRKQAINVTANQIMSANPGVNWNKLRIGQKIFIPAPKP